MALPNGDRNKMKVYPDEYINNITVNRTNLRLLDNDIYLEGLVNAAVPESGMDAGVPGMTAVDEEWAYFYVSAEFGWVRCPVESF